MINNRQGNRRRGRNNSPRQNNNRGGGDSANRIDSRARGNAAQLLEKYKNMARDAQMQGDRVLTEYYLQFADHYFRVLADVRARQEEQQAERRARHEERSQNWRDDNGRDFNGREENEGSEIEGVEHGVEGEPMLEGPAARDDRDFSDTEGTEDRPRRGRQPRADRGGDRGSERNERNDRAERPARTERAPRGRKPAAAANGHDDANEAPLGLDASLLPPSIAPVSDAGEGDEAAAAPRPRRGRRPKAESVAAGPDATGPDAIGRDAADAADG